MYNKIEGGLVDLNAPTRAFPKFAYDQREARRQQCSSDWALSGVIRAMPLL